MKKHNVKKICALMAALCVCLCLCACDGADYKKAETLSENGDHAAAYEIFSSLGAYKDSRSKAQTSGYLAAEELFEAGSYDEAALIYGSLGDYLDSEDKVRDCVHQAGMSSKSDRAFLEDIERSVNKRNELVEKGESDSVYVGAELAILEKYENAEFYDPYVKQLALRYIDGLRLQMEALDYEFSQLQIVWTQGLVDRYSSLCELYENYGIFKDDPEFEAIYVSSLDDEIRNLDALKAIDADLTEQLDGITFGYKDWYTMTAPYTNNTEFDFDLAFTFTFYDYNGVRVENSEEYFPDIRAGEDCMLEFWRPDNWYSCEFFWEILNIR